MKIAEKIGARFAGLRAYDCALEQARWEQDQGREPVLIQLGPDEWMVANIRPGAEVS